MLNEAAVENEKGVCKVGALARPRPPPGSEKEDESDVPVWEPRERRTEQFNIRITKSLKKALDDLSKVFTHVQRVQDNDDKAEVTVTDLVERFLRAGVERAWEEIEFPEPHTDDELDAAKKAAVQFFLKLGKDAAKRKKS